MFGRNLLADERLPQGARYAAGSNGSCGERRPAIRGKDLRGLNSEPVWRKARGLAGGRAKAAGEARAELRGVAYGAFRRIIGLGAATLHKCGMVDFR